MCSPIRLTRAGAKTAPRSRELETLQPAHHVVAAAPEEIVEPHVLTVEDVVRLTILGPGRVARSAQVRHRPRRIADRVERAAGNGAEHRRTERRRLARARDRDLTAGDVREHLHDERVALGQAAARDECADRETRALERLDDHAGAERGRLDQRAIDV